MILTNDVNIFIKGISIQRYRELGYNINTKEKNTINTKDLPINSNIKVIVKCDNCGLEKELKVQDYYLSYKNDKYSCNKCKSKTYKQTMLKKYGVENGFQLKEIKDISKETKKTKPND